MKAKYVTIVCDCGKAPSESDVDLAIDMLDKKFKWDRLEPDGFESQNWRYAPQSDNFLFTIYRGYK